ncbi:MBL fold metallo-hydrolase [soil metagenome]|nr:MBL fold metallo-hydrolase [Gemmatimonadota bacterium]
MERIRLTERVHYLHGGVNSGLVETEKGLLVIDSGLDRSAANRIVRAAEELKRPLVAVLNTHAHADHYGGNAQLVRKLGIPVYAPAVEEAVIREPRYEPIYLFGGAAPIADLENRFLQAEPSPVDHVVAPGTVITIDGTELEVLDLSGHSIAQVGIRVAGVLFAADAFFGLEALKKHRIPYNVDAEKTRRSMERVGETQADWYVPGHGEALQDPRATLTENIDVIDSTMRWLTTRLDEAPATTDDLLVSMAEFFGLELGNPTSFVLYRTTLLGYLTSLHRAGGITARIADARWLWAGGF